MKIGKISLFQLFSLIYLFELGSAIVVGVGVQAKQDAWLAILLGMAGGLCLFQIYHYLYKQFPELPLTGYIPKIVGRILGIPLSFVYILYFLYIAARVLRDFGDLLITSALDETPLQVINGLMILLITYGIFSGLEVISRTGESILLMMLLLGITGIVLTIFSGIVEVKNLAPVLENGWKPLISTVTKLTYTFPFGEMIAFTMILPAINDSNNVRRMSMYAMLASGLTLSFTIALEISVLGVKGVEVSQFPLLDTIGRVSIGNFIQRLDIIVVATLILGVFVKITVFFYAGFLGLSHLFHIKRKKYRSFLILGLSAIILTASIKMSDNFADHIYVGLKVVPIYLHLPLQTGIPLLLLILTWIRKKWGNLPKKNHSNSEEYY